LGKRLGRGGTWGETGLSGGEEKGGGKSGFALLRVADCGVGGGGEGVWGGREGGLRHEMGDVVTLGRVCPRVKKKLGLPRKGGTSVDLKRHRSSFTSRKVKSVERQKKTGFVSLT